MSDTDDYDTLAKPDAINFDLSLPATHNYLGVQFDDVCAPKVIHHSDEHLTIPILALHGAQLLPGQTIPLRLYAPFQINMIKNRIENSNGDPTVGFIIRPEIESKDMIGTLAEIISCKSEDDPAEANSQWSSMMIKVKGRERFRILKIHLSSGSMTADVRIMPEFEALKNPLRMMAPKNTRPLLDSFFAIGKPAALSLAQAARLNATRFPAWMYRQYDCAYLMQMILKELSESHEQSQVMSAVNAIPTEPSLFSNWLLTNFPFDDQLRLNILKLDCINQRLKYIYSILKQYSSINCRICRSQICQKADVFSMCAQGFMSAYMNPHGHIHETLTVYKAKNLNLIGRPSTEYSWFPGYAWTICQCKRCGSHIGWKFTATKENLKPEKFWGLTRKAVCHTNDSIQRPKSKISQLILANGDHQYSSQVSVETTDGEGAQQRDDSTQQQPQDPWMPIY